MNCTVKSLYLCVRDMERAIRFYDAFLEQPVTEKDELYSVFAVSYTHLDSEWGEKCRFYIKS